MPERSASAVWNGLLTEGKGTMRMASGAYEARTRSSRASRKATARTPKS